MLLQLCEFSYVSLPFGIATASTIRVGNMLGAGQPETARQSGARPYLPYTPCARISVERELYQAAVDTERSYIPALLMIPFWYVDAGWHA